MNDWDLQILEDLAENIELEMNSIDGVGRQLYQNPETREAGRNLIDFAGNIGPYIRKMRNWESEKAMSVEMNAAWAQFTAAQDSINSRYKDNK